MTLTTIIVGALAWFSAGLLLAWILGRYFQHQKLKTKRLRHSLWRYLRHRQAALNPPKVDPEARFRTADQIEVERFLETL